MAASASLSFDEGITTSSCMATFPLRIRVSMSAMGSVMVMVVPTRRPMELPRGLRYAGDFTRMGHLPQADAAEAESAVDGLGPAASPASGVSPHLELGLALLLLDERLLGHGRLRPFPGPPEREVEGVQESLTLVVRAGRGHDRDVHAPHV